MTVTIVIPLLFALQMTLTYVMGRIGPINPGVSSGSGHDLARQLSPIMRPLAKEKIESLLNDTYIRNCD